MRTIKLYITCSDELALDKNVIGNLVRQLNHVNNPKGISIELWDCEDYDLSDAVQSDMFVALFHKEADKLSFDGVEKANEAYSTKKSPKVFIYFKDLGEGETTEEELTRFKQHLCDELGHFVNRYFSEDSIKFSILMQVMQVEGTEKAEVRSSKVVLGDEQIADLNKIPFAGNNPEYQKLLQELTSVNSEISQFQAILSSMENEALDAMLFQKRLRREQLMKEIEESGRSLMSTAEQIAGMYGQISSERLRKAVELFESGDNRGANAILDYSTISEEMTLNIRLLENARSIERRTIDALKTNLNECELKIKTICNLKEDGWLDECCRIYDSVISSISNILLPECAQLRLNYAYFLLEQDYDDKALEVLTLAIDYYKNTPCDKSLLAKSLNNLAIVYRIKYQYAKSCDALIEAKEIYKVMYESGNGNYGKEYATVLYNLASLHIRRNKFQSAEEELSEALSILHQLDKENPHTVDSALASTFKIFGSLYKQRKKLDQAEEYYSKSLKIYSSLCDIDEARNNLNMADILHSIGGIRVKQGLLDEAESIFSEAITRYKDASIYYPNRCEALIMSVLTDKAMICFKRKKYEEAIQLFKELIPVFRRLITLSADHNSARLAMNYNAIGDIYLEQSQFEKAEDAYTTALNILSQFSEDNESILPEYYCGTLKRLGNLFYLSKQYEFSEKYYNEAITRYNQLGYGHSKAALPVLERLCSIHAIQDNKTCLGDDYSLLISAYRHHAGKYPKTYEPKLIKALYRGAKTHEDNKACDELSEAIALCKKNLDRNPYYFKHYISGILSSQGRIYKCQKQYEMAEQKYSEAISITKELSGMSSKSLVGELTLLLRVLADVHLSMKRNDEATQEYLEAVDTYRQLSNMSDNNKSSYIHCLIKTSKYHYRNKEYEIALSEINEVITWLEGNQMFDKLPYHLNGRSYCLFKLGKYDEALTTIDKAIDMAEHKEHYLDSKGEFLLLLGKTDEASALWSQVISINPQFLLKTQSNLYEGLVSRSLIEPINMQG